MFESISDWLCNALTGDNKKDYSYKQSKIDIHQDPNTKEYVVLQDDKETMRIPEDDITSFSSIFNVINNLFDEALDTKSEEAQKGKEAPMSEEIKADEKEMEEIDKEIMDEIIDFSDDIVDFSDEIVDEPIKTKGVKTTLANALIDKYSNYKNHNTKAIVDLIVDDLISIINGDTLNAGVKYDLLYDNNSDYCKGIRLIYFQNRMVDAYRNFKNPLALSDDDLSKNILNQVNQLKLKTDLSDETAFKEVKVSFYFESSGSYPKMVVVLGNNKETVEDAIEAVNTK